MLNEVQIEGIITREPWRHDKDLFFRIASYRDADMPVKPDLTPGRDEPDYLNVRIPGGATSLMTAPRGSRVRIHGFLQSRDFKESLADFMRKANRDGFTLEVAPETARTTKIDRNTVEVVANRVLLLPDEKPRDERRADGRRDERPRRNERQARDERPAPALANEPGHAATVSTGAILTQ
jgi:hypothetical protein